MVCIRQQILRKKVAVAHTAVSIGLNIISIYKHLALPNRYVQTSLVSSVEFIFGENWCLSLLLRCPPQYCKLK